MHFPVSTGQAAVFLGSSEPQLGELVRRGKIKPPPSILAGRRLWHTEQLLQAAAALGVDVDHVRNQLQQTAIEHEGSSHG